MKFQCVAVFTTEGCRIFKIVSVRNALAMMDKNGIEIMRGICRQGLYHEDKSFVTNNNIRMLMTSTKPTSKYDEVHLALGHPGKSGMEWHRKNT